MTNNGKTIVAIGFTWQAKRDVMGIWIACDRGMEPLETARAWRKWPSNAVFRTAKEIRLFGEYSKQKQGIERENIERGLKSLTAYIENNPNTFAPALRIGKRPAT